MFKRYWWILLVMAPVGMIAGFMVAAEVVRSYRDYSHELVSEGIEKGISELRKTVRDQEDRVEDRRKILSIIVRNKGEDGGVDPQDKQDFGDATREYEMELSLLEQLKLKLITEEITLDLPNETVVIHDNPVIADYPISPNVTLNLVAGAVGGVLISPFLALPLMWWMNRRKGQEQSGSVAPKDITPALEF